MRGQASPALPRLTGCEGGTLLFDAGVSSSGHGTTSAISRWCDGIWLRSTWERRTRFARRLLQPLVQDLAANPFEGPQAVDEQLIGPLRLLPQGPVERTDGNDAVGPSPTLDHRRDCR